jgi:hypothetical protein
MNEPKFTKGPWCINDENSPVIREVNDRKHVIAVVAPRKGHCNSNGNPYYGTPRYRLDSETRRANVNLILAAPEMYDFINFFETFAGQCYCRILGDAGQKIYDEAVKICKKARGEA